MAKISKLMESLRFMMQVIYFSQQCFLILCFSQEAEFSIQISLEIKSRSSNYLHNLFHKFDVHATLKKHFRLKKSSKLDHMADLRSLFCPVDQRPTLFTQVWQWVLGNVEGVVRLD